MSVISLPDREEKAKEAVDAVWEFLSEVQDIEQLRYERKKARVNAALEGLTDEEVFQQIQTRRGGNMQPPKSVKQAELETLVVVEEEIGNDRPDGNFYARTLPRKGWEAPWMKPIERIVLVHRLREVLALAGFTRFEAVSPNTEGELELGVRRASLAHEITWLPAIENKGEGVFIQFSSEAINSWFFNPKVQAHGQRLEAGFRGWLQEQKASRRQFPGLPYILLHSFSHLLITAVSLECGYPASSIRERIYALPSAPRFVPVD